MECIEKVFNNCVFLAGEMHPTINLKLFLCANKLLMYVKMLLPGKCEVVHAVLYKSVQLCS